MRILIDTKVPNDYFETANKINSTHKRVKNSTALTNYKNNHTFITLETDSTRFFSRLKNILREIGGVRMFVDNERVTV